MTAFIGLLFPSNMSLPKGDRNRNRMKNNLGLRLDSLDINITLASSFSITHTHTCTHTPLLHGKIQLSPKTWMSHLCDTSLLLNTHLSPKNNSILALPHMVFRNIFNFVLRLFVYCMLYVCLGVHRHSTCVKVRGQLVGISFHREDSVNPTQIVSLCGKCCKSLSHPTARI